MIQLSHMTIPLHQMEQWGEKKVSKQIGKVFCFSFGDNGKQLDKHDCYISKDHKCIETHGWASPQYNEPHLTPLFLSKGQGLEIGN